MAIAITRRAALGASMFAGAQSLGGFPALAQTPSAPPPARFGYSDVVERARELVSAPFQAPPSLPRELARLDAAQWSAIQFRSDRALFAHSGAPFRLELFHLGGIYRQPVTVNTVREGLATPVPYAANLFDYHGAKFARPLPVNLGFAGFRLRYPLNDSRVYDEVIAFLGASYYRFLGRGQRYGLSARGLTVDAGTTAEQFPYFREFWIETPGRDAASVTIYALLDGESVAGAYQFVLLPKRNSALRARATLFARRSGAKFGLAPLTSMFFKGADNSRNSVDYRPQLHNSDGLLMRTGAGEWIWRPLRDPRATALSDFLDHDAKGFGLLQRDRRFQDYQDIDRFYQIRPSYWIEPDGAWGGGRVELVEIPTPNESNDNIVCSWVPDRALPVAAPFAFAYSVTASLDSPALSPNGRAVNTFQMEARAYGSLAPPPPRTRRFLVDFSGGDLSYWLRDPKAVEAVASVADGTILRTFISANPHVQGFRAGFDVQTAPDATANLRLYLRAEGKALTETWTLPWSAS